MHTAPVSVEPRRRDRPVSVEQWLAIPEEKRAQLIHGRIVYEAMPGPKHGATQGAIFAEIRPYSRRSGGSSPGGWWISLEVDMFVAGIGCRPDVVGWRRDRHPELPSPDDRGVVIAAPDFVCEVLSSSTARYDQGEKRDAYFQAGVAHYWLVDPSYKTLTVLERSDRGYVILLVAGPGDTIRAAPFDGVEIPVEDLFLDEGGKPEAETPSESPEGAP